MEGDLAAAPDPSEAPSTTAEDTVESEQSEQGAEAAGKEPCLTRVHTYAAAFIIKGIAERTIGNFLEGITFFRNARVLLADGKCHREDEELFHARCSNFSVSDFPEELKQIPREGENNMKFVPLEGAVLAYLSGMLEARALLMLGRFGEVPAVLAIAEQIVPFFNTPEGGLASEVLKALIGININIATADLLMSEIKYSEAIALMETCLSRCTELPALYHMRPQLQYLKGKCLCLQGLFDESINCLKEAEVTHKAAIVQAKGKEAYDEEHDSDGEMATIRQAMAEACLQSYRLPMALSLLKQTLASRKHLLGVHHIDTVETNLTLAHIFYRQFNLVRAMASYDEIINQLGTAEMVAAIGTDSLILSTAQLSKGDCLRTIAKYDEAKNLYSSALRIRKLFFGDIKHVACAQVVESNAVNMCMRARTYASAEPAINQCIETRKIALGESHPQYARALYYKGCILMDTKAYAEAAQTLETSLQITLAAIGESSWPTTEIREALAAVKIAQGSLIQAKADINGVINARKIFFGQIPEHKADPESHPEVAGLFLLLAEIERLNGDSYENTLDLVFKAVKSYHKATYLGKSHPRSLAAKCEQYFVTYKMAPTISKRHFAYLKMKMGIDTLIGKGYCEDHPWVVRYCIDEEDYPDGLLPGNPYEDEDEGRADEELKLTDTDGDPMAAGVEVYEDKGNISVVGTGSGEIEGCDDGGAEPVSGDPPDLSVSKYLYIQGKKLLAEGDLKSAKTLFEQCHSHRQRTFGNNEVTIFALLEIAEVDFRMGNYSESDLTFRRCIDEFTAVCGSKSLQVAEALHRIGLNYHVLGNYKLASENLSNAMQLRRELLNETSKDLATSFHCIGLLKLEQHVLDDAQTLFAKSFQVRKQKFGEKHLDVAESFVAKALLFEAQAKYSEALNSLIMANTVRENCTGDTLVTLVGADCLLIKARITMRLADYETALATCVNAYDMYVQLLGESHPRAWAALYLKAQLNFIVGNITDSKKLHEQLLQKKIDRFGDSHISVADSLFSVAEAMREMANYGSAEDVYKSAISVLKVEFVDRHPKILSCDFGIAECHRALGHITKSKAMHEKVKRNRMDMLGRQHPDYLACMQVAVDFKIRMEEDAVDAQNALKVLLQSKRKILGDEHPDTADALNSLGEFLRVNHRYGEANVAFDEALLIKLKTVGERNPRTIEIVNNMSLRNATFRVKNVALEKQKSLLAQSQTFMKEREDKEELELEEEDEKEENPFGPSQSFEEPFEPPPPPEPINVATLNVALRVRKIEAEGLQHKLLEMLGKNDPFVQLSIEDLGWEQETSVLFSQGTAPAVWKYEDSDPGQMTIEGVGGQLGEMVLRVAVFDHNANHGQLIGDSELILSSVVPADLAAPDGEIVTTFKLRDKKGKSVGTVRITFGTHLELPPPPAEEVVPEIIEAEVEEIEEEDEYENDPMDRSLTMSRIPVFDNSDFRKAVEALQGCLRLLEKVFPSSEKYGSELSPTHPLIANIKGNIGVVEKLEAEAKAQFVERLSKGERRMFLAAEEAVRLREFENNEDEIVFEPGQKAIHEAIMYFEQFPFDETHHWRIKFKKLAEKGTEATDDSVRVAENLLAAAVRSMQRNLVSNAYNEYEESNKVLTTDPRKAAQGHMLVAIAQQGMAKCLSYMCKFDEAKVLYQSSVAMQRKLCPDDDEMVASILFDLAEAQRQCGSYDDAVSTMTESLEVRKELRLKADKKNIQPSVVELQSMLAVANLHLEVGQYMKGLQMCNEIVEIAKMYSFPIPLELSNAYVVQAKIFIQLSRYTQAYSAVDKAHALRKNTYGKLDHLSIAECFQIKAMLLLLHKADYINALRLSNMALLMRKRCIIASLTVLDDYEIAAKTVAEYEEKSALLEAQKLEDGAAGDHTNNEGEMSRVVAKVNDAQDKPMEALTAHDTKSTSTAEFKLSDPSALHRPATDPDDPTQPLPEHFLIVESLLWKGRCQHEIGKMEAATKLFEEALEMNTTIFSKDHYMAGVLHFHLAEAAYASYAFKSAHEHYILARDRMLQQFGEPSLQAIEANCGLAENYRGASKFYDSANLLENIFPQAVQLLTDSHPLVARICYALGRVHLDIGNFSTSQSFYERSLAIRQGSLLENNPSHPLVALSYFGVGECLRVAGAYSQASVQYEKAQMMIMNKCGEHHPISATISHGLSTCRRVIGQYLPAKLTYEAAMIARRDIFGKNHVATAESLLGIAYNSFDQGIFKAASPYFKKALQVISDNILSEIYDGAMHHALLADVLYGCAENARALADYAAAEEFYTKAIEQRCAIYGEDHFLVHMARLGLADVYCSTERWEDATKLNKASLDQLQNTLGEEDKRVAKAIMYTGFVLEAQGKNPLAKGLHERAYAMLGRILGSSHGETARSLWALARVSFSLGKLDLSKAQHDVALRAKKYAFSGQQADIALSYAGMGYTYLAMGLYDLAYILFLKAICIQRPQLGDRHPQLYSSLMGLGEVLRALGRFCDIRSVIKEHEDMYGSEYIDETEEDNNTLHTPAASFNMEPATTCNTELADTEPNTTCNTELANTEPVAIPNMELATTSTIEPVEGGSEVVSKAFSSLDAGSFQSFQSAGNVSFAVGSTWKRLEPVGPEVSPEVRKLEVASGYQLDAYAIYMAALQSASKCLGAVNLPVAAASIGLAKCLSDMGRFREASVLCRDVLKMQRRLVGEEHAVIIRTLSCQASILLRWGRLYPVEEVPVFNPEVASEAASSLHQHSTADLSLGWAVASTRQLTQSKGGFTWKHGYCNKEKPGVPGGFMGYQFPVRPAIKRDSIFDDNLVVKDHPINTIDEFQKSRDINDPYSISIEDDKFLEYISEPLTGDAEKLIEVGLQIAHKKYPPTGEHPDTADLLLLKAQLFRARGVRPVAKKAYAQALAMRQRLLGPGHPAIAEVLLGMAENSLLSGEDENAAINFNKSLLFREKIFGRNHVIIAENLLGLAAVALSRGRAAEARELAEEALILRVKCLSKGHYLVATASQVLGSVLLAMDTSIEEARLMFKNAIDVKIKTFGQYHYEVCSCCNDYALILMKLGRLEEAVEIFQDAYKVQHRLFGDLHADIATTIHNEASARLQLGQLELAERLYLESLRMKRELFGFEHPLVATALHNIAGLYQIMDKLDSAYKMYAEALSIRIYTYGEVHESVAETQNNLGLLSFAQGRFNDSIDEFECSIAIKRRIYKSPHLSLAATLNNLACVHHSMQNFDEAERLYTESLQIREVLLGDEHPDSTACRNNIAGLEHSRSELLPHRIKNNSSSIAYSKSTKLSWHVEGDHRVSQQQDHDHLSRTL